MISTPFEVPWRVTDLAKCNFYHTFDLPMLGLVSGLWDLRPGIGKYFGNVDFTNRSVLDVGTASGFLSFAAEERGASEVTSLDLPENHSYDLVPASGFPIAFAADCMESGIHRIKNGYWLCHELLASQARVLYRPVREVRKALSGVDIVILGNVLIHSRDPFEMVRHCARLSTEALVITEAQWDMSIDPDIPTLSLVPSVRNLHRAAWWQTTPSLIVEWSRLMGFSRHEVSWHEQHHLADDALVPHFTVCAYR